jgi:hypothetical protein
MTGEPGSELQQYLQWAGQPRVGISITWKGFFMITVLFCPDMHYAFFSGMTREKKNILCLMIP